MGPSQRTRVPNGGPTSESLALLSLLNFMESSSGAGPESLPIASSTTKTKNSDYDDYPLVTESGRTLCPTPPFLGSSTRNETDENTSIPELFLGPSSLKREFPCSLQPSASTASTLGRKRCVQTLSSGTSQAPPQEWVLHRAPSGKLTTILPSPLCQEVAETFLEKAEESPTYGLIYAGYRIFSKDPRKSLGLVSEPEMNESISKKNNLDVVTDVGIPVNDPASLPLPTDDDTPCRSSSWSSAGTLSMRRDFRSSSSSPILFFDRPNSTAVVEDNLLEAPNVQFPEGNQCVEGFLKQNKCVPFCIRDYRLRLTEQVFNPSLRQGVESEEANQPTPSDAYDEVRMQFRSRRGPAWNWVNKQLERLFLHAVNLSESEFVELSCCNMKEVQAWLDEHNPHIGRRSMERWVKSNTVLKNAGIKPNELNENVLDIFEWMTQQEQAEFIKAYQRLYAIVKASQEGLHLTQSEMEHFSRLSLADKIDFIEEYKDKREQRETIRRRDTASSTANPRRFHCDQDKSPFAECSDLESLQSRTGLSPKGRKVPRKPISSVADGSHVKYLQFDMGQEKSGEASSISTYVRAHKSVSLSKPGAESIVESVPEQETRKLSTTFTGDGRPPYRKFDASTAIHKAAKIDMISEENQDSTTPRDNYSCPKQRFDDICELLPADPKATEVAKDTPPVKMYAEASIFEAQSTDLVSKTLNNCLQDCNLLATSLLPKVLSCESTKKTLPIVETDGKAAFEALPRMPVVEASSKKEWHGEHPGFKLSFPTLPPTELSAEGVISPVTLVNDKPSANLCGRDVAPVVDNTRTLTATKSEPCTPCHQMSSTSRGPSISYAKPPSYRTIRGLPSAYALESDLSKVASLEKSLEKPKTLRKKFSTLWSSLRSKKSRDVLKDAKYY